MNIDITSTGLLVPDAGLWLDPSTKKPAAFISHAHTDHARGRHEHILCTAPTAGALRIRLGDIHATELDYERPIDFGGCRVTLYPAGHVLGSAQVLIERDGHRLVYTGDFKLRPSLTCPPATIVPADTLIVEATYGLPVYRFPPAEESRREIVRFAQAAFAENRTPVFLGYSFGKGPEITKVLDDAGIPTMLHESIYRMLEVYVTAGIEFRDPVLFDPARQRTHAAVIPPSARRGRLLQDIPGCAVAVVTGFAALDRTFDGSDAEACICLSDHADWPELLAYVQKSGPSRVLVTHGYCGALAGYLRQRGFDAQAVRFPDRAGDD